jgi:xanthine/uracil permease
MSPRDRFGKAQDLLAALVLIVIGCFCLVVTLGVLPADWLDITHTPLVQGLPVLLIGLGFVLLLMERAFKSCQLDQGQPVLSRERRYGR